MWASMLLFHLLLLIPPTTLQASGEPGDTLSVSSKARVVVLPIVFSSPDTRWAGGVLPHVVFRLPGASRASSARVDAYYTQNAKYAVRVRPTLWFSGDTHTAGLNAAWKKWPTTFYDVGSTARDTLRETYTDHVLEGSVYAMRQIAEGFFAGVQHDWRYSRLSNLDTGGLLATDAVRGSRGGFTSGLGIIARYDNRNHDFYPTGGGIYQLALRTAGPATASDYTFSTVELNVRRYVAVRRGHTLALQGYARLTAGGAPFQALPGVGSVFRGYPTARYIDANLFAFQAEYRVMPVFWRVGLVGFGGLGQTTQRLAHLSTSELKYTLGAGLRIRISRRDAVNIRWDYGFGLQSSGDYIDLGEAF